MLIYISMNKYVDFYRKIRQIPFIDMSKLKILINWNNFIKPRNKNDLLYLLKIYNILYRYLLINLETKYNFNLVKKISNNEKIYKYEFYSVPIDNEIIECYLSLNKHFYKKL